MENFLKLRSINQSKWSIGNSELEMFNQHHRTMFIDFDVDIDTSSFDGDGIFEKINVEITNISWCLNDGDVIEHCTLNERNTKRIHEMIENAINDDPERFGVDIDDLHWNDHEPSIFNTIYSGFPNRVKNL